MKRFDLMFGVNVRGTYCCSQACIPYLKKAANPHILTLAPPLNMKPKWFKDHVAYTMAKYGMSMCVLGMAEEFRADGIAVNALWPRTVDRHRRVAADSRRASRRWADKPEILADAAYIILNRDSRKFTGNFCIDEDVLASEGITDLDGYAFVPGAKKLLTDLFLD